MNNNTQYLPNSPYAESFMNTLPKAFRNTSLLSTEDALRLSSKYPNDRRSTLSNLPTQNTGLYNQTVPLNQPINTNPTLNHNLNQQYSSNPPLNQNNFSPSPAPFLSQKTTGVYVPQSTQQNYTANLFNYENKFFKFNVSEDQIKCRYHKEKALEYID